MAGTNDTRVASVDGFDKKAHEDKDCEDTSTSVKNNLQGEKVGTFPLDSTGITMEEGSALPSRPI